MIAAEDHRLLMEALMFFSPGEDHDDQEQVRSFNTSTEASHFTNGPAKPRSIYTPLLSVSIATHQQAVCSPPMDGVSDTATCSAPSISPPSKPPLRRKRVKKCTYAARREEVARLRSWTVQLEAQLEHLQKRFRRDQFHRQQARYERELLANSQAAHVRLLALVAENNARIHALRANQC